MSYASSDTHEYPSYTPNAIRSRSDQNVVMKFTDSMKVGRFAWSSTIPHSTAVIESTMPIPRCIEDQERIFHEHFAREVSTLLHQFRERFPHRHVIQWSMFVGNECRHDLAIEVEQPDLK